jgi:hypothetical protein
LGSHIKKNGMHRHVAYMGNCLCSSVCCVLFERGVLFYVMYVVSYCSNNAKTPFEVNMDNNNNNNNNNNKVK